MTIDQILGRSIRITMKAENLCIIHFKKSSLKGLQPLAPSISGAVEIFKIETCQRAIWTFQDSAFGARELCALALSAGYDVFLGKQAYEFLLRVSTGLESEIKGEADIFGQVKQAWKAFSETSNSVLVCELWSIMKSLFEDTKDIRARFLQNAAQGSYGSLVRKWLKTNGIEPGAKVTVLGAGKLSRSILPWLAEFNVQLWNRSEKGIVELKTCDESRHFGQIELFWGESLDVNVSKDAEVVIYCIPPDREQDARRLRVMNSQVPVLHLGGTAEDLSHFDAVANLKTLDAFFKMQTECNELRATQLKRAYHSCAEKSILRAMGGSVSLPHGWEDLALFSSVG